MPESAITESNREIFYTAVADQTDFAVTFKFQQAGDLSFGILGVDDAFTPLSLGVDYTVTGADADAGGTIHLLVPATAGTKYRVRGEAALEQNKYLAGARFAPDAINSLFERSLIWTVEQNRDVQSVVTQMGNLVEETWPQFLADLVHPARDRAETAAGDAETALEQVQATKGLVDAAAASVDQDKLAVEAAEQNVTSLHDHVMSVNINLGLIADMTALLKAGLTTGKTVFVFEAKRAGIFKWDATSTEEADGGLVFAADEGGVGRWVRDFTGSIHLTWYGTAGDRVANDTVKVLKAITAAMVRASSLFVATGSYLVDAAVGLALAVAGGSLHIYGEGMTLSNLIFDNVSDDDANMMYQVAGNPLTKLKMWDIGFEGFFAADGVELWEERKNLIIVGNVKWVEALRCRFAGSFAGGLVAHYPEFARVEGCFFDRCYRDPLRIVCAQHAIVKGNFIRNCLDDVAISAPDPSNPPGYAPFRTNAFGVTDNIAVDSAGFVSFGGKNLTMTNNLNLRPITRGFAIGETRPGFEAGATPILNANVHGNITIDPFMGDAFDSNGPTDDEASCAFQVHTGGLAAKDISMTYDAGTGTVRDFRDYLYEQDNDTASKVNAGHFNVSIKNNHVFRTLKPTAKYSDYGFGSSANGYKRLTRQGWKDPEITEESFVANHFNAEMHGVAFAFEGNSSIGAKRALRLVANVAVNGAAFNGCKIRNNFLIDFSQYGLLAAGNGYIGVEGNWFDGDPLCRHPNRTQPIDGSWQNPGYANHAAIRIETASGLFVASKGNTYKNVGTPISSADPTGANYSCDGDTQICDPVAPDYNAGNKGIGQVMRPVVMPNLVIEGGDPTDSATFGKPLQQPIRKSNAMPTTGDFLASHFVESTKLADPGLLGWVRKTNRIRGQVSSHVLGTDWYERRV